MVAKYPESNFGFVTGQHYITRYLWVLTEDLNAFRLSGLLLIGVSSYILYSQAIKLFNINFNRTPNSNAASFVLPLILSLMHATTTSLSPSYNLLAAVLTNIFLTLMFWTNLNKRRSKIQHFLFGVTFLLVFVNKIPQAIAFLIIYFMYSLINKVSTTCFINFSFGFLTAWCVIVREMPNDFLQKLEKGSQLFVSVQTESIFQRLNRYALDFTSGIVETFLTYSIVLLALILFLRFRKSAFLALALLSYLIIGVIERAYLGGQNSFNKDISYFNENISFLLIGLAQLLIVTNTKYHDLNRKFLLVVMFAAPIFSSVGTGNSIFSQMIIGLAPWGLLFVILKSNKFDVSIYLDVLRIIVLVFLSVSIFSSAVLHPYMLPMGISNQTQSWKSKQLGDLKVDPITLNFVTTVESTVAECNIENATKYLGIFNAQSIGVISGLPPVVTPWIVNREQLSQVLATRSDWATDSILLGLDRDYDELGQTEFYKKGKTLSTDFDSSSTLDELLSNLSKNRKWMRCGVVPGPFGGELGLFYSAKASLDGDNQ